jgi:hypothetical protein
MTSRGYRYKLNGEYIDDNEIGWSCFEIIGVPFHCEICFTQPHTGDLGCVIEDRFYCNTCLPGPVTRMCFIYE